MRVTQNYSLQSLLRRVNQSRERIHTLQENLATGKRINRISDHPEQIGKVLRFRKMLKTNSRFESNLKNAIDFMGITSGALDDAADIMATVKELAVQGSDDLNEEDWNAYAEQIDQMLREMVDIGNTRFEDRYVFGGSNTTQTPFMLTSDGSAVTTNPNGIDGALKTEIAQHRIDRYNVSGKNVFQGEVDIFQTLLDLREAFRNQDTMAVQDLLTQVDQATDQILQQNASLGAKMNRYEMFIQQYQNQNLKLQEMLSRTEDTDVARAVTELQMQQTGLTTALQVLSRTLNISLVDFMS